jgi:hypothetical protein
MVMKIAQNEIKMNKICVNVKSKAVVGDSTLQLL